MSIGRFGDDGVSQPSRDLGRQEPKAKKAKIVFQETLHEVRQLARLPQDDFHKQLPRITQSIHSLFSQCKQTREQIPSSDVHVLVTIQDKLKKEAGIEEKIFNEIGALRQAFQNWPCTGAKELSITSSQAGLLTPRAFWEHLSKVLENNPSLEKVEIEGQGSFERAELIGLLRLETLVPPKKLRLFVDKLAIASFPLKEYNPEAYTPFHQHVLAGREDLIAEDLQNIGVDTLAPDELGFSALQYACLFGHTRIAKQLIYAGADCTFGIPSAFNLAALGGDREIVKFLLDIGVRVNDKDATGYTPLMMAAQQGHLEIVKILLQSGADPNKISNDGARTVSLELN